MISKSSRIPSCEEGTITEKTQLPSEVQRIFVLMTDPDKLYVVCPYRLDDVVICGVLAHAVLEKFEKESAVLIIQDSFKGFDVHFEGVSEIKYASTEELMSFRNYVKENNQYVGDNWIYGHYHMNAAGRLIIERGLNFWASYKRNVFDLPIDTPIHAPRIADISDDDKIGLGKDYVIDRERTVILAPHSHMHRPLSPEFWSDLINRFKAEGCVVYTNIARRADGTMEQPLDGTLPMRVSLNEIYWLADKVKYIIGMRSGLFDLLAFSNAKMYCMAYRNYSNDLNQIFPDTPSKIRTLYLAGPHKTSDFRGWGIKAEDVFTREVPLFHSLIESIDGEGAISSKGDDISPEATHIFELMTDPNKLYIVCPHGIGDLIIIGGFAHALRKKYGKDSVEMIAQERIKSLDIAFDDVDEIKHVPREYLYAFRDYCKRTKRYIGGNYIYGHYALNEQGRLVFTGRLSFADQYRNDICYLPLDTPYHAPYVKDISDEAKTKLRTDYVIDKERTVILAPHANTYRPMERDFWKRLIENLNRNGAVVYTNVGKNVKGELEAPLEGTLPLHVNLNEIYWLADKIKCIIGLRSGLFDLLVFSKATLFCMAYNKLQTDLKEMFPSTNSNCRTMYLMESVDPEILRQRHVRAEEVFPTVDDLLEELIKSIEGL